MTTDGAGSDTPVRWGILGTARIADKVSQAIQDARGAELVGIASRDLGRARVWAEEHGVPRPFGSYEELVQCPDIEAIYIPLPNTLHAEWTLRAAEAGKHVLCEKPLAHSVAAARRVIAACAERRVQLMDGVMWAHHERTAAMRSVLQSGELGELQRVTAAFTFGASRSLTPDNIRFQRELLGGSLYDLGWYCVGAALWAFGELPERVLGTARFERDVDMSFNGWLWFPGNRFASFDCGFETAMRRWLEIAGREGSLVCDDFVHPWSDDGARFWVHGHDGKVRQQSAEACVQHVRMIEQFSALVRSGTPDAKWPAAALAVQQVCAALDRSARSGVIVEMAEESAE